MSLFDDVIEALKGVLFLGPGGGVGTFGRGVAPLEQDPGPVVQVLIDQGYLPDNWPGRDLRTTDQLTTTEKQELEAAAEQARQDGFKIMAARDPDSGKFISVEEQGEAAWQNFEVEVVNVNFDVPDSNLSGATGETALSGQQADFEPAGGLHRGEVAELVAVIIQRHMVTVKQQSGQGTTPGNADYHTEWSRAPLRFRNIHDNKQTTGGDGDAFMDLDITEEGNNQLLYLAATTEAPFNDTVQTTGGGGSKQVQPFGVIPYRDLFGMGPLVFDDEAIEIFANLTTHQIDTEAVSAKTQVAMVWDVFEESDRAPSVRNIGD